MNDIVIVGAGKTGRGFLGRLCAEAGVHVTYVDKNAELAAALNAAGSFAVNFFGNCRPSVTVKDYSVCTWENAVIPENALILISVCGQNLKDAAASLKEKLIPGAKYQIITAENSSKPSKVVREVIGMDTVSVSEGTVFCTTIEGEGLEIRSQDYPYFQYDAELLPEGYDAGIPALRPVKEFGNFLTRKLYTYNAASCVIAYLGALKGYTDYASAANDPEILALLDKNYAETGKALCAEYGYDPEDQAEFALLSRKKFCDRTITDTVNRNARDPQRKLAPAERITGPMALIEKYGLDADVLYRTTAAALLYDAEGENAWQEIKEGKSASELLESVCGISADSVSGQKILRYVREYEEGKL